MVVAANLLYPWAADDKVKTALIAGLKSESRMVREQSVRSLEPPALAGDAETLAALKPLLTNEARTVRIACAWALRATVDLKSVAGRELQTALDQEADQPRGQYQKALLFESRKQPTQALANLQKAIGWDVFSPPLRTETADVLSQFGQVRQAGNLEVACQVRPESPELRLLLGQAWAQARRFDKAADALQEAVRLAPSSKDALGVPGIPEQYTTFWAGS